MRSAFWLHLLALPCLAALCQSVNAAAKTPASSQRISLWDERISMPQISKAKVLDGVSFHVIKKWEPKVDGYKWLHGVALAWHKGKLYASFVIIKERKIPSLKKVVIA